MRYHAKQQVITWQEFDIDLPDDVDVNSYLAEDPFLDDVENNGITVMHEQSVVICTELYDSDETYPKFTWLNKKLDELIKIIDPTYKLLTGDKLKKIRSDFIFAEGVTTNDGEGVYMTSEHKGDKLRWIAVKGGANDWCIFIGWSFMQDYYILRHGDKVTTESNIKKLVPCTEEAFNFYNY